MNRRWPGKNSRLFLTSGIFLQKRFYHWPWRLRLFSVMLLLIPMVLTSCMTLPPTSTDISIEKPKFEPLLLTFYNGPLNHLNGVRRGHCPMSPSCSVYCNESLKKHGFWVGWMMTCDRLMRCSRDELARSPQINMNGEIKCYDPVIQNDRWWYTPDNQWTDGTADINSDNGH